ncbi:MAG: hypothetical protein L6Q98_16575 [Anaerolineae bacterium]|nr:hypothetical protein [Anaerolineae bacterium]NUQ04394.1 hypothetical protein [Anaerolineae bacterium]
MRRRSLRDVAVGDQLCAVAHGDDDAAQDIDAAARGGQPDQAREDAPADEPTDDDGDQDQD